MPDAFGNRYSWDPDPALPNPLAPGAGDPNAAALARQQSQQPTLQPSYTTESGTGFHGRNAESLTPSFSVEAQPGADRGNQNVPTTGMTPFAQTGTLPTGVTSATSPASGANPASGGGSRYQSLLDAYTGAVDPQQKAMAGDALARQVYSDLKAAGHDVKWQGDQLIVDGRPYVLGQGVQAGNQYISYNALMTNSPNGPQAAAAGPETPARSPVAQAIIDTYAKYGRVPDQAKIEQWENYNREWGNPGVTDYMLMRMDYDARGDESYGGAPSPEGYGGATALAPSFAPSAGGAASVMTTGPAGVAPGPGWVQTADGGWVPPDHPLAAQAGGARFPTSGPTYAPGAIDTLDTFNPNAGNESVTSATRDAILQLFGDQPVDQATEQALLRLLESPESLDDRTVDMLKARSREEQMAMADTADEELRAFGASTGLGDAPWLAAERARAARDRDDAIIAGNRDIDLAAAQTRTADRQRAIELGTSYGASRAAREQGNVAAANSFSSLQADTAFKTAALQGDRLALRESVNQKAAELGLSGDQLQLQYTLGLIDDATRRYGIDIGASIDRAKLEQAGREFQEDLAFRYAQLAQLDAQFGANLGLGYDELNQRENSEARDATLRTYGL